MKPEETEETRWARRVALAEDEIKGLICRLPTELRGEAERLPVTYERRPNRALQADGLEPDILGLFVGDTFADAPQGFSGAPPQILLFLENIREAATENGTTYREEVRTTYLHELGHFLGLEEGELEERDLE